MRARLAVWVRWLAEWLDPPRVNRIWVAVERDEVFERARALVRHEDVTNPNPGFGQAKRRNVYARLKKEFPERSHRELSLVMEVAGR